MDDSRYPIGNYSKPKEMDLKQVREMSDTIASFPERLEFLVENLEDEKLKNTYRPGSWNIAQLVHHLADSHMNGFTRLKLALTEDNPVIRPYNEKAFAELPDGRGLNLEPSLLLLRGLHTRWAKAINAMSEEELQRQFVHPEGNYPTAIYQLIALYSWHGDHHLAHIKLALNQKNPSE